MSANVELVVLSGCSNVEGQSAVRSLRVGAHEGHLADGHRTVANVNGGVGNQSSLDRPWLP